MDTKKDWSVIYVPNSCEDIHIIPNNDDGEHLLERICPCNPTIEHKLCCSLVKHSAYDGREYEEQIKDILDGNK